MGNPFPGEEQIIPEIEALSPEAKGLLNHHLNNSLSVVIGGIETGHIDLAKKAAKHIIEDLERFGIRDKSFRRCRN